MAADLQHAIALAASGEFAKADTACEHMPSPLGPAACVLRGSMWRQLGDAATARIWDMRGRDEARDEGTRIDAEIGLIADAIAAFDLDRAAHGLRTLTYPPRDARVRIRWHWITAEYALAGGDTDAARRSAEHAIVEAQAYGSERHVLKSQLIAAVACGDQPEAVRCAHQAADHQWRYLAWAATSFLGAMCGSGWLHWADDLAASIEARLNPAQARVWQANPAVMSTRVALGHV